MALVESPSFSHRSSSLHTSSHPGWVTPTLREPAPRHDRAGSKPKFDQIELSSELDGLHIEGVDALGTFESIDTLGLAPKAPQPSSRNTTTSVPRISLQTQGKTTDEEPHEPKATPKGAFHKWMRTLHRRAAQRPTVWGDAGGLPWQVLGPEDADRAALSRKGGHRHSSSGSSFGFVSAVRSASVSLASVSAVARSRRNTARSHGPSRTDRSSRASISGPRISEDSVNAEMSMLTDPAALDRSVQRRRILEELIDTEEGYIGDIRFLTNVYITILAALPTLPMGLRSSINRNLTDIVELHEGILGELHRVVPDSEYTQMDLPPPGVGKAKHVFASNPGHRRWSSLDAVLEHDRQATWLQNVPGMLSDPQVVAEVAKVFGKKMNRFFIYKEYGAKYEMMIKDVASAHRSMPEWETYQKGLEALASTLSSVKSNDHKAKKSLTIGDLLVKPIQRICKYPLLFAELLKYTPVVDCPNSHMEVEAALMRLREATAEINRATNDARMKATLEKTWLLQDRLVFPNRKFDAASKNRIRSFGHIRLCGALHTCWQTKDGVEGQYFICLLYRDVLCLASAGRVDPIYTIHACIRLNEIKVEDVDNGRGLQCHTAPFSWKLVFECDHQLYEMIMTACTPKEEMEWRARLNQSALADHEAGDAALFGSLDMNIKSLGTVFGKPGTIARRISIHRATTVGPKSPLCQVVLKNTSVVRDGVNSSPAGSTINRSQSLLTTNSRVPILAPSRSERARLETLLADVWSREMLPFPGMTTRSRSEHLVRTSASSVMRKLSVASITSSFNKRSGSASQRTKGSEDAGHAEGLRRPETKGESGLDDGAAATTLAAGEREPDPETARGTKRLRPQGSRCALPKADMGGFAPKEVSGTVHRRERMGAASADESSTTRQEGQASLLTKPSLRRASSNSLRVSASTMSEKSPRCSVEKENRCQSPEAKSRGHGRWPRVGMAKGEGKGHGFRSLFR